MFTRQQVIEAAAQVAKEQPDGRNGAPSLTMRDDDGNQKPCCLVGQVLYKLSPTPGCLETMSHHGMYSLVYEELGVEPDAWELLGKLMAKGDNGAPWAEVVSSVTAVTV